MQAETKFVIKTYSKTQVAGFYDISMNTLRSWIKKLNKIFPDIFPDDKNDHSHLLTPKQVSKFVEHYGAPF